MNFSAGLVFSTCLLVTVLSMLPVGGAGAGGAGAETNDRVKRRSYLNPWSSRTRMNSVTLYDASNMYRAAPYKMPRPYYIPVYGAPGRPVIFYPPQPLYVNPGMPQDNPQLTAYPGGPTYLPPNKSPHFPTGGGPSPPKGPIGTRGDTDDDDDDDDQVVFIDQDDPNAPVWAGSGVSDREVVQMPLSGDQTKESGPVPTRAPMVRPNQPPLVHGDTSATQSGGAAPSAIARPTPRPQSIPPPATLRTTTTVSPPSAVGPSNCVWAIISCCSATSPATTALQNCFEQRGCPGPFWGPSPCDSEYARAAINAAVKYYNTRSTFGK